MSSLENYDPNKPVCDNQDDFNKAFRKAIKHNDKENMKKARPYLYVYLVIWVIFLVWALMLAMKIPPGQNRVVHTFFALVAAPAYVLAYYLGAMQSTPKATTMGYYH